MKRCNMEPCKSFGRKKPHRLGFVAVFVCVFVPTAIIGMLEFSSQSFMNIGLRVPIRSAYVLPLATTVEESKDSGEQDAGMPKLHLSSEEKLAEIETAADEQHEPNYLHTLVIDSEQQHEPNHKHSVDIDSDEKHEFNFVQRDTLTREQIQVASYKQEPNNTNIDTRSREQIQVASAKQRPNSTNIDTKSREEIHIARVEQEPNSATNIGTEIKESVVATKVSKEQNNWAIGDPIQQSKITCNLSGQRSDTCFIHGDVRILGKSSTVLLASSSQFGASNTTWKIRPYARKWETSVMGYIKEITLKSSETPNANAICAVNHSMPAVVFSTGGFLGNFFHDFTDVLIPLFTTAHQYNGEVQFLVTDFNSKWINKYKLILKQLSRYEIINLDTDARVRCFKNVHVGLDSHKVMGIDPSKSPNGYSMADFREFLRESLALKRRSTKIIEAQSKRKPRLLIILRKRSRALTNTKEVTLMARRLGYKVVTAGPEETRNLTRFAQKVNSCDVMMGVHGAGLTNMIFLPTKATLIQIIPWGGLTWACRHDFGEPAPDMGIRYVEYEIKEEESSLIEQYPRDHAVFTDPTSIHKQGWNSLWSTFLDQQKVKLDVGRFRPVLLEAIKFLKQ